MMSPLFPSRALSSIRTMSLPASSVDAIATRWPSDRGSRNSFHSDPLRTAQLSLTMGFNLSRCHTGTSLTTKILRRSTLNAINVSLSFLSTKSNPAEAGCGGPVFGRPIPYSIPIKEKTVVPSAFTKKKKKTKICHLSIREAGGGQTFPSTTFTTVDRRPRCRRCIGDVHRVRSIGSRVPLGCPALQRGARGLRDDCPSPEFSLHRHRSLAGQSSICILSDVDWKRASAAVGIPIPAFGPRKPVIVRGTRGVCGVAREPGEENYMEEEPSRGDGERTGKGEEDKQGEIGEAAGRRERVREAGGGWWCACGNCMVSRRSAVSAMTKGAAIAAASTVSSGVSAPQAHSSPLRPLRPRWYEEYFAFILAHNAFEKKMAVHRNELFPLLRSLDGVKDVVDLGIGTGPNLKYFAQMDGLHIIGVDPNASLEKYVREEAAAVGILPEKFQFLHAVGENIPLEDSSVDAVVSTWVLCSVLDQDKTLSEIKRVLKPKGAFLFIEHVVAPDGGGLGLVQKVINPLQRLVADGCELTRNTAASIEAAQFESLQLNRFNLPGGGPLGPHIMGIAKVA